MSQRENVSFLGEIKPTGYLDEVSTSGVKSVFRKGILYRYPGIVPMLEVQGDHYEMGLQYAVLLHRELVQGLESYTRILYWLAARENLPPEAMLPQFKAQALNIMQKLPERFIQEMQGIADGTALPVETVAFLSLHYDVLMSGGCTGVLMRSEQGGVIHARNNDTSGFGGEEFGRMSLIVKHRADGYHEVTHIDYPFFMGVETGHNSQGLTFSEETLNVREPNPDGFSLPYLIRIIMEECGSLADLPAYFDHYPVVGAYGTVWSDRRAGKGMVAELTPTAWKRIDLEAALLWNFNHFYSAELLPQQAARVNINPDLDREAVACTFPRKDAYRVEDALDFISLQVGPEGLDYSRCGTRFPVCNKGASQAMLFDPHSLDCYLGVGVYYAARQNIYRIYDDFSKPPTLFRAALPMKPVVVEAARIHNLLVSNRDYRDAYMDLCSKYQDDAQVHFLAAYYSYLAGTLADDFQVAERACQLAPEVDEYRLFAGLAAYQRREFEKAVGVLEKLTLDEVVRKQEPLRLYALQKCWEGLGEPQKAQKYAATLKNFLERYDAQAYFEKSIQPLLDR